LDTTPTSAQTTLTVTYVLENIEPTSIPAVILTALPSASSASTPPSNTATAGIHTSYSSKNDPPTLAHTKKELRGGTWLTRFYTGISFYWLGVWQSGGFPWLKGLVVLVPGGQQKVDTIM